MRHSKSNAIILAIQLIQKYGRRPAIWPAITREFLTYLDRRIRPGHAEEIKRRLAHERTLAGEWCASVAIAAGDLPNALPFDLVLREPAADFPEIFKEASARVVACPVKLGGAGNLCLLYSLAKASNARQIIETGVAYGWSSLALLLSINGDKDSVLHSVDLPYLTIRNDDWVGIAVPENLKNQWKLLRMADREGLPRAIKAAGAIDMAHYDSDKSPHGRAFGYGAIWRALRAGGILISDDVSDNLAFKEFAEKVGQTPLVIKNEAKFQGILIK